MSLALLVTLLASFAWSLFDTCRKALVRHVPPGALLVWLSAGQLPLFAAWCWLAGAGSVASGYVAPAAASVVLNVVAGYLFLEAVRISPLSVTIPLLALTPAFAALVAIPIVGEAPDLAQWAGIALVVGGTFTLNARPEDLRSPRRLALALVKERGSVLMIVVALLWSLTPAFDKVALAFAHPALHGLVLAVGVALGTLLLLVRRRTLGDLRLVRGQLGLLCCGAILVALAMALQLVAIQLALVSFVEAVKRAVGITMSQITGKIVFGERLSVLKLASAVVITLGVVALLLS